MNRQPVESKPTTSGDEVSLGRVLVKASLLFAALTLLFGLVQPLPWLEKVSAYNVLFPGRARLPFGEVPDKAYNLSLYQLDAMFASHEVSQAKPADAFRILVIGDSSIWGYLLAPEDTVSAQLQRAGLAAPDGRRAQVYNLGYPTISLTKDLLMLNKARAFEPDLVIWFVTLEAFPKTKQLESPIVQNNASIVRELIQAYRLDLDLQDERLVDLSFWQQTLVGQRRALADLLRLQLYGVPWAATGIDQYIPEHYEPPQHDLQADLSFQGLQPPALDPDALSLEVLDAGIQMVSPARLLIVNEPVYLSEGENSDIRYNFFYPRWAYDEYREVLADFCQQRGVPCLDAWNVIPPAEFTNSAIHYNREGARLLTLELLAPLQSLLNR